MSLKVENPSVKTAEDDQISPVQNGRGRGGSRGGSRGRGGRGRGGHGHGGQHGDSDQTPSYGGYGGQSRGGASKMERDDERINHQLQMMQGPTIDLPPRDRTEEKKFGGRNRLYIGGLTSDVSEEEIKELFGKYGEFSEMFLNKEKFFGFIRFDYRANAERAKLELDGQMRKGKSLRIRLAPHQAAIKVKNLSSYVTNELLEKAFSVFGEIERAVVFVNERGFSTGEGIVEFVKKPSAQAAVRKCNEGCFFLTSSLRPVVVEELSVVDDEEGYGEKNIPKKTQDYVKEREVGPRFAYPGSFEYEYGLRWKQLLELYKQKTEAMEREMKLEEEKLISQMELAKYEHETEMLREQLRQREMEQDRTKRQWEMRERQYLDARRVEEEIVGRKQEDLQSKMRKQEEDLRRRQQDNSMFLQQQQFATQGGFSQGVFPKAELDATAPIPGFDVEQPPRTGTAGPMLDDNSVRLNTENGVADIQLPDLLNMRFPAILDGKFFNVLEHDPHSGHVLATCQNCPNKLIKGSSKATTNFHKHLKAREIKSEIRQDEDMDEKKYLYVDVSRVNSVYPEDESGYQLDMPTDGSVDVKMENISSSVTEHNTLGLPENHHLELPHLDIIERTTSSNSYASYIEEERRDGTLSYNEGTEPSTQVFSDTETDEPKMDVYHWMKVGSHFSKDLTHPVDKSTKKGFNKEVRLLMKNIYTTEELLTSSVEGTSKGTKKGSDSKRPALPRVKTQALIDYITSKYRDVNRKDVKQIMGVYLRDFRRTWIKRNTESTDQNVDDSNESFEILDREKDVYSSDAEIILKQIVRSNKSRMITSPSTLVTWYAPVSLRKDSL
ncbi:hrp65 protein-like isoform X4 [Artemia franciscana]|uniref:hrp65 protein-like isoform X4 n=1 Tax=Artemia franciscana TaxID=6661 RepID=UPI0032DB7951